MVKIVGLAHSQGLDFEPEDKSGNLGDMSAHRYLIDCHTAGQFKGVIFGITAAR